ncbi:tigger transposable element-derived protein 2-like [Belonocnema kinseyi]|uniref:tigger transposable element-derived protein 2-like n=1 Tax=Belonocnema kinseyi TaxID=2817044 RepID=UPI00143E06B9|nr:tigger transposable element-derived protein 2-like [Belonocnema kinseyi]
MPKEIKRQRLSFKEQYELVSLVKAGTTKQDIIRKYGISEATYKRVLSREADLNNKVNDFEYLNKKTSKTSSDVVLDAAVFDWFKQASERGDPISGPIIQEKARILNEELNGSRTFKASNGWLNGFKRRYGIQSSRKNDEKLPENPLSAAEFSKILKAKIESENLILDNIYNADESEILWRQLTACTLALHLEEEEAAAREQGRDQLTALFCANASGSHRIPLLIIGKSETPKCLINLIHKTSKDQRLKRLERLGVTYTYQNSASMDTFIFMLWYKEEFIPRVLERQRMDGITGKVLLLLDDAHSHPSLDELNAINENVEVVCLPRNETELIQPMDQGLVATTKKLYKKIMLRHLFLSEKSEGALQFLRKLNLRDCFVMLCLAWGDVKASSLQRAWKPLFVAWKPLLEAWKPLPEDSFHDDASAILPDPLPKDDASAGVQDPLSIDDATVSAPESATDFIRFPHEICDQISEMLSGPSYSVEKARDFLLKWFESDHIDNDWGWESLSDSDSAHMVTNGRHEPETATEIIKCESLYEHSEPMEVTAEITTSEAFVCLMKLKKWVKSLAECLPKHLDYIRELEILISEVQSSSIL